jgi:hypothetical protein
MPVPVPEDIATGVFDRFRSLPIARWAPLAGAVLGDITRCALSVAISLFFGMLRWIGTLIGQCADWVRSTLGEPAEHSASPGG